jgi:uncharacterized protein (DUF1697 family)
MKAGSRDVSVALLRGVNVGGHNKLPMKSLAALCEAQGCCGVQTYIQSGNVLFLANAKTAAAFPLALKAQIKEAHGFETTAILRTTNELRLVTESNPFLTPGVDTKFLYVMFLSDAPNQADVARLKPLCVGGEAFALRGREIFLYLPNGGGRSKLATYAFDKILRTVCSTRNWQTVTKLLALMKEFRSSMPARS